MLEEIRWGWSWPNGWWMIWRWRNTHPSWRSIGDGACSYIYIDWYYITNIMLIQSSKRLTYISCAVCLIILRAKFHQIISLFSGSLVTPLMESLLPWSTIWTLGSFLIKHFFIIFYLKYVVMFFIQYFFFYLMLV